MLLSFVRRTSKMSKVLHKLPSHWREDAFNSLVYDTWERVLQLRGSDLNSARLSASVVERASRSVLVLYNDIQLHIFMNLVKNSTITLVVVVF